MDNGLKIETSRSMHTILTHLLMIQIKRAPRFNSRKDTHTHTVSRSKIDLPEALISEQILNKNEKEEFNAVPVLVYKTFYWPPASQVYFYFIRTEPILFVFFFSFFFLLSFRNGSTTMT